jgi:predicted RNA polymerase sigma factor
VPDRSYALEDLLRSQAPQVLGALVRRYGHFDAAEDAVQEALLAATQQWPKNGVPESPRSWLITAAARRMTDHLRTEQARRKREDADWSRAARMGVVRQVLYLIFNEGYTNSGAELADEAIRLTRQLHRLVPTDSEVSGLLALMLLTHARRQARTGSDGALIPMDEQERTRWDRALIIEGSQLVSDELARTPRFGPYLLQAAIAAVHDEASGAEDTDWPEILSIYQLLTGISDNPVVTLNHAVAVAMVDGPTAGLDLLASLDGDTRMTEQHRLDAVRAHLLEMTGDFTAARTHYLAAARRTTSLPERAYLEAKASKLS